MNEYAPAVHSDRFERVECFIELDAGLLKGFILVFNAKLLISFKFKWRNGRSVIKL